MLRILLSLLVVGVVGCAPKTAENPSTSNNGANKLEPKAANSVPDMANTAALRWIGFPFDKPIAYRMQGFRGQTVEGGREYSFKTEGDKVVIDVSWTGEIGAQINQSERWIGDASGVRLTTIQGSEIKPAPLYLPADPKAGFSWNSAYSFESLGGQGKLTVVSKSQIVGNESVKVPLGTYNALVLRETGTMTGKDVKSEIEVKTWFAEGVGMVKAVNSFTTTTKGQKPEKMTITFSAISPPKE